MVWDFVRLGRPLLCAGSVLLFSSGAAAAFAAGYKIQWTVSLAALAGILAAQCATHYANDYFDQAGDQQNTARTLFSGGSGVLAEGRLSERVAWYAALFFLIVSLACTMWTGFSVPLLIPIGCIAIALGWTYSAPPLRLASSGISEWLVPLLIVSLVPAAGYIAQTRHLPPLSLLAVAAPLALLQSAMVIAFTIPDYPADRQSGKRTMAVRLGLSAAAHIHNAQVISAFATLLVLALLRFQGAALPWCAFPFGLLQIVFMTRCVKFHNGYSLLTIAAVASLGVAITLWCASFLI